MIREPGDLLGRRNLQLLFAKESGAVTADASAPAHAIPRHPRTSREGCEESPMTPAPVALPARQRGARRGDRFLRSLHTLALRRVIASLAASAAHSDDAEAADAAAPGAPIVVREAREVSVVATRGERNLLDVPANVTVIDAAAIARSGAASVPELLRREAGLFVTNTTTNPEGFSVEARGFQNGGGNGCRTLVLIDGRRANEADTGCADWTFVTLRDIERIEIVRGPGSAAYGDNALGGVIAITTKRPGADGGTSGELGAGGGSWHSGAVDGAVRSSFGALGVGVAASWARSDGFRTRSDYDAHDGKLDLRYDLGELGSASLVARYGSNERSRPGAIFVPYGTRDGEQASPDLSRGADRERSITGELALTLPGEISLRATPHWSRTRAVDDSLFSPGTPFEFPFHFEDEQRSSGIDLQLSHDFDAHGRALRVLGGGEFRREDYTDSSDFAANVAKRDVWGLFAQLEATLADDWLLSAGVRYDETSLRGRISAAIPGCSALTLRCHFDDHEWSPRVALTWRFAEPGALWASYAEGFRFPNLNEAFGAFGFSPSLAPEHSKGFELGAKWRAERWRGTAVFHRANVDDEIFFEPDAPNPVPPGFPGININVDRVRHQGVELSGAIDLLPSLELYATYTFDDVVVRAANAVVGFAGQQLPITPKHRGNLGLRARLPHGFEASVDALYVGERRVANDVSSPGHLLPSYATYQARVGWTRELARGVALSLEGVARNLTNRHYAEWGGLSAFSGVGYFPSPERNYSAGVRVTYTP
jgi:iron complex outermembrane receptor protein